MAESFYLSFKSYMQSRYGKPLYRVPVDLGFGCPNRTANGHGGCTFCAEDGGRARQIIGVEAVRDQVQRGIQFAGERYGASAFMLYIQAYTGTFTNLATLRRTLAGLIAEHAFTALSIGTRPDCLTPDVIDFLQELNRQLDVWVELGVQTTHDPTLKQINRKHTWDCSRQAILNLHRAGLKGAAHVILGLPGETAADWVSTAETLARLPIAAIKIHNLHILKGTALAEEYARSPFPVLNEHDYADAVIAFLRRLPPDLPVMRLTTDSADDQLLAPKWELSKGQFLDFMTRQMAFRNVRQGDLFSGRQREKVSSTEKPATYSPLKTGDGSITFWNPVFKEHYHASVGAYTEAMEKFIRPGHLRERLRTANDEPVRILDICFGLGYNSLAACEAARRMAAGKKLEITALEIDAGVIDAAAGHVSPPPDACLNWQDILRSLRDTGQWQDGNLAIRLAIGDARARLPETPESFDLIFLDAFSTQRNAELWTVDFFRRLRSLLKTGGALLTYSAALPVRAGFRQAGFSVGETPAVGRKRGGTIAVLSAGQTEIPLKEKELEMITGTTRGLPYRDPRQTWTNRQILRDREKRIQVEKQKD